MRARAGVAVLVMTAAAAHAVEPRRAGFTVVGQAVGEGGDTPPFWREYERASAARDRGRFDALKKSNDPYDRVLAIYLAPVFDDMPFVEGALSDTRLVE